ETQLNEAEKAKEKEESAKKRKRKKTQKRKYDVGAISKAQYELSEAEVSDCEGEVSDGTDDNDPELDEYDLQSSFIDDNSQHNIVTNSTRRKYATALPKDSPTMFCKRMPLDFGKYENMEDYEDYDSNQYSDIEGYEDPEDEIIPVWSQEDLEQIINAKKESLDERVHKEEEEEEKEKKETQKLEKKRRRLRRNSEYVDSKNKDKDKDKEDDRGESLSQLVCSQMVEVDTGVDKSKEKDTSLNVSPIYAKNDGELNDSKQTDILCKEWIAMQTLNGLSDSVFSSPLQLSNTNDDNNNNNDKLTDDVKTKPPLPISSQPLTSTSGSLDAPETPTTPLRSRRTYRSSIYDSDGRLSMSILDCVVDVEDTSSNTRNQDFPERFCNGFKNVTWEKLIDYSLPDHTIKKKEQLDMNFFIHTPDQTPSNTQMLMAFSFNSIFPFFLLFFFFKCVLFVAQCK
ncbi:hypothetical protein RFI_11236, partial [Reticulomyxa filosa]